MSHIPLLEMVAPFLHVPLRDQESCHQAPFYPSKHVNQSQKNNKNHIENILLKVPSLAKKSGNTEKVRQGGSLPCVPLEVTIPKHSRS